MSVKYPQYSNSTFPNSIDSFQKAIDIIATDLPLIDLYYQALQSGTAEQISQALVNIPQGAQKIDSAQRYNQLRDAVLAIENYVQAPSGGFQDTINIEKNIWNNKIAQFGYKGIYNSSIAYLQNNIVSTQASGDIILYIALQNSTNVSLSDTAFWRLLTISASGKYLTYRNNWSSTLAYEVNNSITYKNQLYICISANTNQIPDTVGSVYWKLLIGRGNSKQYPFQNTIPTAPTNGQIWFDTTV